MVTEVRRPNGTRIRFRYDREGDLLRVIKDTGEEHVITRDRAGRIIEERSFDGRLTRHKHDLMGRIVRIENAARESTEFTYDPLGRLLERAYADDSADRFAYDAAGPLVSAESSAGVTTFAYDDHGRLLAENHRIGDRVFSIKSEYDAVGKRVRRATSLGHVERLTYDATGQPTRVILGARAAVDLAWDARGFMT